MSVIYAAVARRSTVLAEHAAVGGNFRRVARDFLGRLPESDGRNMYLFDDKYNFFYITARGVTYLSIAEKEFGSRLQSRMLENMQAEFLKHHTPDETRTAVELQYQDELRPMLQNTIATAGSDKITEARAAVNDAMTVAQRNIEALADRGEKLNTLADRTSVLETESTRFQQRSTQLKRVMCLRNAKLTAIIVAIVLVVILVIVMIACQKCRGQ
eukprot:TRINITY_DN33267_c0_g1_i1.p1 TRINITY_DN33267_c0_g1~~TRINITY_DN33267_c0_g1_i1.p1  ORF type:complete len:214 (+),score=48.50 TRINITY_DN33267_c0_g1_i1:229-870(+)